MARALLKGAPLSPGIAIGPLLLLPDSRLYEQRPIGEAEIEAEVAALDAASVKACSALEKSMAAVPEDVAEYRDVIAAQVELARDPRLLGGARARIRHKKICAAWALTETIAELSALFQGMPPPLSERAHDIHSIGKCLLDELTGFSPALRSGKPAVLAAWDISPADLMDYSLNGIQGLLTAQGGPTSHLAILARGLKVPAIAGVEGLFHESRQGEMVILDGLSGHALLGPDEADLRKYNAISQKHAEFEHEARAAASRPAATRDGARVKVLANLENPHELSGLARSGAEGIGLYRTEFSYLGARLPKEDELYAEYLSVIQGAGGKNVVFRTLDVGADKILPSHDAPHEPNPALGLRGIRFCLKNPDVFRPQLRALLRAGHNASMSLLLPMISTVEEAQQTRALLAGVAAELEREGVPHAISPPLGIMLETPAAALNCHELARLCDFLSIGTNDLLHYIMAIDRNNPDVAYLHDPLHPAFLRAISYATSAAHAQGKTVSVCGELARDPLGTALLAGLGIDALSATPHYVPTLKQLLRKLDASVCARAAREAMAGAPRQETIARLRGAFAADIDGEFLFSNSMFRERPLS